ncbi:MAG TPA: DUF6600 domain-containing protein, partial [Puia sp.]|nr:DUF6600 domain-containing protein [Puia sp.]
MKKLFIFFITAILTAGIFIMKPQTANAQASVSFQVFYDQLSPYGTWVNYPRYGYAWIPTSVSFGFRPYATSGHWIYTPDGWAWVSDYPWGWAAFHYGRWYYDDAYGWMWLPGYEWAPAWVTWGEYQDNYCWAPIGPSINIGIAFSTYRPPAYCWTFAPRAYITSSHISNYYVNRSYNTTVINNITVINNVNRGGGGATFMRGPQRENVERYTHNTVQTVQIAQTNSPGRSRIENGQLAMYHPAINRNAGRPVPAKVQDMHTLNTHALPAINRHVQPNTVPANQNRNEVERVNPNHNAPANANPNPNRVNPNTNHVNPSSHPNNPQPHGNPDVNTVRNNPHPTVNPNPHLNPAPNPN